jgi:hypothetical protein
MRRVSLAHERANDACPLRRLRWQGGRPCRYAAPDECDEVPPPHCLPSGGRIVAGEAGRSEAPCGKQATSAWVKSGLRGALVACPPLPGKQTSKRALLIDCFDIKHRHG